MKKILLALLYLFPVFLIAQESFNNLSTLGFMWKKVGSEGFSKGAVEYKCLKFSPSGVLYLAYNEYSDSNKITVKKFEDNNWKYVGDSVIAVGKGIYISLAFDLNGQPNLAYQDYEDTLKATVKKFDGTHWINVGNAGFSPSQAHYLSLAFNQSGLPYVAFSDRNITYFCKATVMKYDGSNWVFVGNEGFSAGQASYTSLAFNSLDQPYVAYMDWSSSIYRATVKQFTGSNWVTIGNPLLSAGVADETCLAFNSSDQPYVAYIDNAYGYQLSVKKLIGNTWVYEGIPGFSNGNCDFISFGISPLNQPYVSFRDWKNSSKATVMKFDGNNWINEGNPAFSLGNAAFTSLAFNPINGQVNVAYSDGGKFDKATVMKYDSVYVDIQKTNKPSISLYPNPVSSILTIDFINASDNTKVIRIVDFSGIEVIKKETNEKRLNLNLEFLTSGTYFVCITSKYGCLERKFSKIKNNVR